FNHRPHDYFVFMDDFWKELLQTVRSPMNSFSWTPAIYAVDNMGTELGIEIDGRRIYMVKEPADLGKALLRFPDNFVTTTSFTELIKGIGVQEQTFVNRLAAKGEGYYRRFNGQRLAHDLIGAMLLEPENKTQLYYCFLNVHEFAQA